MPPFNYIITIHNKEDILRRVLDGVAEACGPESRIIPVLDGCTDRSEEIARQFASETPHETYLVFAPDVHEIKSINLGLQKAKEGYVVLIQDDVILNEPKLETLVHDLCEKHERSLGYLSFRMGADIQCASFPRRVRHAMRMREWNVQPYIRETDVIVAPDDWTPVSKGAYYEFVPRMVGIKSPVCLTPELRALEPMLDEALAPYCYDDVDLSLRALKHGLTNGLFPIHTVSEIEWGGTRKDPNFSSSFGAKIMTRNRRLIWTKHGDFIAHAKRDRL